MVMVEDKTFLAEDIAREAEYVMDPERAREVLGMLEGETAALDFETTGLDPVTSKVRLSCIYHPELGGFLLDHFFCGSFQDLIRLYKDTIWIVYNAKFEWAFFDNTGLPEVSLMDVDFMAKSVRGGGHSSLGLMAKRDVGIIMDKEMQSSDWSLERLMPSQILYAALDAVATWKLFEHWRERMEKANVPMSAAYVFQEAVEATVECEQTGLQLDVEHHVRNIRTWEMKQKVCENAVRRFTPESVLKNLGSDQQVASLIKSQLDAKGIAAWPKTESKNQLSLSRKVAAPIAAKSPYPFSRWLNALLRFRYYRKYLSTYGEGLVTRQYMGDGIFYRLNIGAAATGRYSSSSINIQNIPRAIWVRSAFLPPAGFDLLCVADYSGIEVRVLAELSGDEQLLMDAIYGDVHAASMSAIYKIPLEEILEVLDDPTHRLYPVYREMRSKAKGFTFQLCYGAQAPALSIVLRTSIDSAETAIRNWAERYPKAYNYRFIINDAMTQTGSIPIVDGRKIYVSRQDRTLPVAANYGIQGAAGSVMLRAMHHVYRLRNERSNKHLIRLCATVHDELLLATHDEPELVDLSKKTLTDGMIQGWLDIFPNTDTKNLVEAGTGPNWGKAK